MFASTDKVVTRYNAELWGCEQVVTRGGGKGKGGRLTRGRTREWGREADKENREVEHHVSKLADTYIGGASGWPARYATKAIFLNLRVPIYKFDYVFSLWVHDGTTCVF